MTSEFSTEDAKRQFSKIVEFLKQPGVIEANYDIEYVESVLREYNHAEINDDHVIIGKND